MIDYSEDRFVEPLDWIQARISEGKEKEWIINPNRDKEVRNKVSDFLEVKEDYDNWNITEEEWYKLVEKEFKDHEERVELKIDDPETVIISQGENNVSKLPKRKNTSWVKYKTMLLNNGLSEETVANIEHDSFTILRRLSLDTQKEETIKGLVVGSVQSGKTTNMAALMSMAADTGWNVFIVLTGMIDKLREQTEDRLVNELKNTNGTVNWTPIYDIGKHKVQHLSLDRNQYIITTLKNKSRLENLISWISEDPKKANQMKVLIIDDEADQASVNTAKIDVEERKTINRLLVNLTNNLDKNGNPFKNNLKAINYIGYTATPYANILNESSEESLYPKDFITLLRQSRSYIGPSQIYGINSMNEVLDDEDINNGIDIIRNLDIVNENELDEIKDIHFEESTRIPIGLRKSVAYFLAASASLRKHNFGKPVTMLIHTSNIKAHHELMYNVIEEWLKYDRDNVLKEIREVWEEERIRFTAKDFISSYYNYEQDITKTRQPHTFEEIETEIKNILQQISPITVDSNDRLVYHQGVHMCIDNSDYNAIQVDEYYRLNYPSSEDSEGKKVLEETPIFLVIGGNTLSRGLTLEGLITTYFLRFSSAADTLMQMGRWFGYRVGYELYPRVWMTENSIEEFQYLAELDYELRKEITNHSAMDLKPTEVGVRLKTSPYNIRLLLTANNKSQSAIASDFDYSGASIQTVIFDRNKEILQHNLDVTTDFINSLEKPKLIQNQSSQSIVWERQPFTRIQDFLKQYKFHERSSISTNIEALIEWNNNMILEDKFTHWNIIVIGTGKINEESNNWKLDYFTWNKVKRSKLKKKTVSNDIRIKALRGPGDLYKDIDIEEVEDVKIREMIKDRSTKNYEKVRSSLNLNEVPQLMIYMVDKDSKASENSKERENMDSGIDIAGVYISIPGGKKSVDYTTHLTIDLKNNKTIWENDLEEDE